MDRAFVSRSAIYADCRYEYVKFLSLLSFSIITAIRQNKIVVPTYLSARLYQHAKQRTKKIHTPYMTQIVN